MTHLTEARLKGTLVALVCAGLACSASITGRDNNTGTGGSDSAGGGMSGGGRSGGGMNGGGMNGGGASGGGVSGGGMSGGGAPGTGGGPVGGGPQIDPSVGSIAPGGVMTKLPLVPELTNVAATPNGDSAQVVFDPFPGAKDYRIYELPSDADISVAGDGTTTVKNGTYRCAGNRYGPPVASDDEPRKIAAGTFTTLVDHDIDGYRRTMAEATVGHVWITPGPGRVPVYALGDPAPSADTTGCLYHRYTASRVKKYTTSADERATLLAARWRDDGIVFYVPAAAGADTVGIYTVFKPDPNLPHLGQVYYMPEGPEKTKRPASTLAFPVLKAARADTQPLMRVFYQAACGRSHDELVPGLERFERVRHQGTIPFTGLLWAPLMAEKTLVIEALDKPCPYQGTMAPTSFPAYDPYEPFFTLDQLRTMVWTGPGLGATGPNPTGEVFINGQGDGNPRPRAIGRSFVKIGPRPTPKMDWFADFKPGINLAAFNPVPWVQNAGQRMASGDYDLTWYEIDMNSVAKKLQWSIGSMLGELFIAYHDNARDTNGKFRLTPTKSATMSKDTFVHATMEVDMMSSGRRYPQLLISDRQPNVQENLRMGTTLLVQTFGAWPIQLQVEWCDHRNWDVNDQCPLFDLFSVGGGLAPVPEISEMAGLDWRVPFDVYASSKRAYIFVNKQPYGCVDLPGTGLPEGPSSVTFGDVLYHSGVDLDSTLWYPFFLSGPEKPNHMLLTARRHYDNLGFSSGVPAPEWDFKRFPCQTQAK